MPKENPIQEVKLSDLNPKKQCSKCKEWKDLEEFNKNKDTRDGLQNKCKHCYREYNIKYWQENQKELSLKRKIYRQENKEEVSLKNKEYRKENKEEISLKNNSPLVFTSVSVIELVKYEEVRESSNSNIECKCTYCGSWFEPTMRQIKNRLQSINGTGTGESRLYCSEGCKKSCPIFHKQKYPEGLRPRPNEVDPELRKMVLARDEYYCQRCGKHKSEVELHCHHITGKAVNPIESHDMDNCVTFCKKCHLLAHKEKGCRYIDLQCKTKK